MATSTQVWKFKLDEIDKKIKSYEDKINADYNAKKYFNNNGAAIKFRFVENIKCPTGYSVHNTYSVWCKDMIRLSKDREALITEMEKEAQYLNDQAILQEQQNTEQENADTLKALAEVEKLKAEIEKAKAEAALEAARTAAAQQLGQSQSGRGVLLGQKRTTDVNKTLIIGGIIVGALGLGFVVYRIIK